MFCFCFSAPETKFRRLKSGVCGVRDVKLLLPDIFLTGVCPWKGCACLPLGRKPEPFTTLLHLVGPR